MPLPTTLPLALLPVRLETRFVDTDGAGGVELRVRIYPDHVHVDAHEPELMPTEAAARARWIASAKDLVAWRALVGAVGIRRAEYVASLADTASPGARDGAWTRPAAARLLPDRWTVIVDPAGAPAIRVTSAPVAPDLAVSVAPDDPGAITDDTVELAPALRWTTDFAAAVAAGMAVTVPLPPGTTGPLRVLAIGVRDRDPETETDALAALLRAHRFTDGLAVLDAGTPTNHTADEAAPWSSAHATPEAVFDIAVAAPAAGAGSVGAALAGVLGTAPDAFAGIDPGPDPAWAARDAGVAAMHTALWPATLGYFIDQMLDGAFLDAASAGAARALFIERVRPRGPYPLLRVGRNPYGVLPVLRLDRWRASDADTGAGAIPHALIQALRAVRIVWSADLGRLPRIGPDASDEVVSRVLATAPVARSFTARSVVGASYAAYLHDFLRRPLDGPWWTRHRVRATAGWTAANLAADRLPRLSRVSYDPGHFVLDAPVVQAVLDDGALAPNYLAELAGMSLDALRARTDLVPAPPGGGIGHATPLLFRIARHAALASYLAAARRDLLRADPARPLREPEMIGLATQLAAPWTWLDQPATTGGVLRAALDAARAGGGGLDDAEFRATWTALAALAEVPARTLDGLVRDALDACSHRLDAWLTAIATARLTAQRAATPRGILIGGYGIVEDLVRAAPRSPAVPPPGEDGPLGLAAAPGGAIHAPSIAHAATAALLRSGYLAHRAEAGGATAPFAVDLRSSRVRSADELLGAIRAGESLGAALGRRVERALLDATSPPLWPFVAPLRVLAAPAGAPFPDRTVVDGYALARRARTGPLPWGQHGLPAAGSAAARAIEAILAELEAALDAVGDVLVAESVHQLAQGNPGRASGALDALARGEAPPSELGVLEVAASGIGLSHRVLVAVPADAHAVGWTATPRTTAEPALEAWCAAVLGPAAGYAARVRFAGADGAELGTAVIGIDALGVGALDAIRAAALGELAPRLIDAARAAIPAGTTTAHLDPVGGGDARASADDLVAIASGLADVLARARPARAGDLAATADPIAGSVPDDLAAAAAALDARLPDAVLTAAIDALAGEPRAGLRAAAALGVAGSVPAIDPSAWPAQVTAATAALVTRLARLTELRGAPAPADPEAVLARAIARLRLIAGDDAPIAPPFTAPASALPASLADQAALVGGDPTLPATWLAQVAAVRRDLAPLERALLVADAITPGAPALGLQVAQLPFTAGEPWIGRPVFGATGAASPPAARRGVVFHAPRGLDLTRPIAALVVDAWSETIPAATHTTAVAFHLEQPTACPPQLIVLGVAPDLTEPAWTDAAVEALVRETADLARLRLVDGDQIAGGAHYLPGLYFAINLAGDTASTDFTGGG